MAIPQYNEYQWTTRIVILVTLVVALGLGIAKILSLKISEHAHLPNGSRSSFHSNNIPPTEGPHYDTVADWGVYSEPLRYEQVLHNLEHGGVAIYYQCEQECPELVTQLTKLVNPLLNTGRKVLVLPNVPTWGVMYNQPWHQDMQSPIAVTAWQHIEKFDKVATTEIQHFIEQYEGIDHHQPSE